MDLQPKISLTDMKKIALFNGLADDELARLISAAHPLKVLAGEFFFFQSDYAERMFILTHGRVKLSQSGADGHEALIRVITSPSLFALVAMTSAKSYPVSAQAAEDSLAIYWTRQELMEFIVQSPLMAMNAMRIMAEQLAEMQQRFRQATTERVERRLAHTLIRLASEAGRKVDEGILIDLSLTRQDLAEMSGTTLYTASRTLSHWEEQGLVICGRERVVISNPHGLIEIAEDQAK
jgi:CRP/FNR family transcriptional regulator, nitrogen oxide reductase regulator